MKSTFFNEEDTKKKLVDFIMNAKTLSMGEETKKFENQFAKKQGRKYAVFVNSGSTANLILLQALLNLGKLKQGDRVGISGLTWATNVMPIIQLGLIPVAIDVEIETLNISPKTLTPHLHLLKALFLTNVLGLSDDISKIKSLCAKKKIMLLEDNCESLGSKVDGKHLGNFGLASTFSFFVGHHLSTIEGGMIATDNEELYHMLIMVRAHGWDRNLPEIKQEKLRDKHGVHDFFSKYTFYDLAYNMRSTDIHGFIGTLQLKYWNDIVNIREKNFHRLHKSVDQNPDLVNLKFDHMDTVSNFAFPVIAKSPKLFLVYKDAFENAGVEIRPIIAGDITKQPFYKKYVKIVEKCENADYVHKHAFYFGNHPELTEKELQTLEKLLQKIK